jgi:hypothetical protein
MTYSDFRQLELAKIRKETHEKVKRYTAESVKFSSWGREVVDLFQTEIYTELSQLYQSMANDQYDLYLYFKNRAYSVEKESV